MGCCHSALPRERRRDTEMGWHDNNNNDEDAAAREMSESDPVETKLELEGTAPPTATTLPAELGSPVEETRQPQISSEAEEPPPYSPGVSQQPVVMNREPRVSNDSIVDDREPRISAESNRSIQPGRASEDSGFEKREMGSMHVAEDPGFDDNKYRGVVP